MISDAYGTLTVKRNVLAIVAVALMTGPAVATANMMVFEFAGTVTSATGIYGAVAVGSVVTGTYTINFDNAQPAYSVGAFGDSYWVRQETTGSSIGYPLSSAYVFSSTAQVGSIFYQTAAPGALQSGSYAGVFSGGAAWAAGESQLPDSNSSASSALYVYDPVGPPGAVSDLNGLPILTLPLPNANVYGSFGSVGVNGGSSVEYQLTSLTRVPEPGTLGLLGLGLAGLGLARRRTLN